MPLEACLVVQFLQLTGTYRLHCSKRRIAFNQQPLAPGRNGSRAQPHHDTLIFLPQLPIPTFSEDIIPLRPRRWWHPAAPLASWLTCGHDSRSLKKALVMKKWPSSRYSIQNMWGVYGDIIYIYLYIFFSFIHQLDMKFGLIMVNPRMGAPKWLCELGRRCSEPLAVDICGNGE